MILSGRFGATEQELFNYFYLESWRSAFAKSFPAAAVVLSAREGRQHYDSILSNV
jgi:hypothetical protein